MNTENPQLINLEQKEAIKLEKGAKGYRWELRTHIEGLDEAALDRLEKLNNEMIKRFGGLE